MGTRTKVFATLAWVAAAGAVVALPSAAQGEGSPKSVQRKLTFTATHLGNNTERWKGKLVAPHSRFARCVAHHQVMIEKKLSDGGWTPFDVLHTGDVSGPPKPATARYKGEQEAEPGIYRARARRGTVGTTTCQRAASKPQVVETRARSGVTIHLRVRDNFKGYVFSPKPNQCADGRTVRLMRQKGRKQHPQRDVKVAKTQATRNSNGKYRWIVLPPHPRPGKYYARASATTSCQADNSKTIRLAARPKTRIRKMDVDDRAVTFFYDGVGGDAPYDFRCKLDDHQFRRCPDFYKRYEKVSPGRHLFKVRAIGEDGKTDRTPAERGFQIPH